MLKKHATLFSRQYNEISAYDANARLAASSVEWKPSNMTFEQITHHEQAVFHARVSKNNKRLARSLVLIIKKV